MPHSIDRTRQEIDKILADSTVLHAVVGAGELAVSKLRETRSELSARTGSFDPRTIREQAQSRLLARVNTMPQDILAAPQQVKSLPEKAQAVLGDAMVSAVSAYGDLANRGKVIVDRARKHQAAEPEMAVDLDASVVATTDADFAPDSAATGWPTQPTPPIEAPAADWPTESAATPAALDDTTSALRSIPSLADPDGPDETLAVVKAPKSATKKSTGGTRSAAKATPRKRAPTPPRMTAETPPDEVDPTVDRPVDS